MRFLCFFLWCCWVFNELLPKKVRDIFFTQNKENMEYTDFSIFGRDPNTGRWAFIQLSKGDLKCLETPLETWDSGHYHFRRITYSKQQAEEVMKKSTMDPQHTGFTVFAVCADGPILTIGPIKRVWVTYTPYAGLEIKCDQWPQILFDMPGHNPSGLVETITLGGCFFLGDITMDQIKTRCKDILGISKDSPTTINPINQHLNDYHLLVPK
jgi:hypothetical protein